MIFKILSSSSSVQLNRVYHISFVLKILTFYNSAAPLWLFCALFLYKAPKLCPGPGLYLTTQNGT